MYDSGKFLAYNGEFHYKGYHGIASRCDLRIWVFGRINPTAIVMMIDVPDGGTSITNRSEHIATQVVREILIPKFQTSHGHVLWIEHYPHSTLRPDPVTHISPEETFDLVTYDWEHVGSFYRASQTSWWAIPRTLVEMLIDPSRARDT